MGDAELQSFGGGYFKDLEVAKGRVERLRALRNLLGEFYNNKSLYLHNIPEDEILRIAQGKQVATQT